MRCSWQGGAKLPADAAFHSLLENDSRMSKCPDSAPVQGQPTSALLVFGAGEFFVVEAVLGTSLASTHQKPAAVPPHRTPTTVTCPLGAKESILAAPGLSILDPLVSAEQPSGDSCVSVIGEGFRGRG